MATSGSKSPSEIESFIDNWKTENIKLREKHISEAQKHEENRTKYLEEAMKIFITIFSNPRKYSTCVLPGGKISRCFTIETKDARYPKIVDYRQDIQDMLREYFVEKGFKNCTVEFKDPEEVSWWSFAATVGLKVSVIVDA